MKYVLFSKTTSLDLPALYCRKEGQPEDSEKCLRLFVIAPHGLICCKPSEKYLSNSINKDYFLKWLDENNTKLINSFTTSHQKQLLKGLEKYVKQRLTQETK